MRRAAQSKNVNPTKAEEAKRLLGLSGDELMTMHGEALTSNGRGEKSPYLSTVRNAAMIWTKTFAPQWREHTSKHYYARKQENADDVTLVLEVTEILIDYGVNAVPMVVAAMIVQGHRRLGLEPNRPTFATRTNNSWSEARRDHVSLS